MNENRDLPALLLAIAVHLLPLERRDWGAAMLAELAQVDGAGARWSFALGCARTTLLAPLPPGTGTPGPAVSLMFLAGVLGCVATVGYTLSRWPETGDQLSATTSIRFIMMLGLYVWLAMRPPSVLVARPNAVRIGAAAGVAFWLIMGLGKLHIDHMVPPDSDNTLGAFLTIATFGTIAATSFGVARHTASFVAGLTAVFWVGIVAALLIFNASMIGILTEVDLTTHMRHTMPQRWLPMTSDTFLDRHMGDHLVGSMNGLGRIPIIFTVLGAVGAMIGRGATRWASPRTLRPTTSGRVTS